MKHWILKSEPTTYSINDLKKDRKTRWDGVRNYQARNNLRAMAEGDRCIIYHSGDDKAAVGLAVVKRTAYKDPGSSEDWSCVDIAFDGLLMRPVLLAEMKAHKSLKDMSLVRQSRLSVCPITAAEYKVLVDLGNK